jgi:hypothetical protein
MSRRWFQSIRAIECDVVLEASGQVLQTVQMPVVPHVGDEMELDIAGQSGPGSLYRVVRVRYHVRPRRLTMRDDLFGVSVFVEPAA